MIGLGREERPGEEPKVDGLVHPALRGEADHREAVGHSTFALGSAVCKQENPARVSHEEAGEAQPIPRKVYHI